MVIDLIGENNSNELCDTCKDQISMQRLLVLGPATCKTEIIFDVIDISFDNSPDFIGIIPFFGSADRSGISTKILFRVDVDHPPTFRRGTRVTLCGIQYEEDYGYYTRLPQKVADRVSEGVSLLASNTAGGRVRFKTNSKFIAIHVTEWVYPGGTFPHMTLLGHSGFDLYRKKEGEEQEIYYHSFIPPQEPGLGYSSPFETDGEWAEYTLNFPLYNGVKGLYIALKKDAVIEEAEDYVNKLPIVYYGSSITQGASASRPGTCYQAIISRRLNMDYVNLGFSGNAKAEKIMAQYLAGLRMNGCIWR